MYIELTDLDGHIPPAFLTQALDDDNDGVIDAWSLVQSAACEAVDAEMEGRFTVPITVTPLPRKLKLAALAFACELCYRRRGVEDEKNPWVKVAAGYRKQLAAITAGELKLSVTPAPAQPDPAGSIIDYESAFGAPGRVLG